MLQHASWIAGFPGLIWSLDIPHSRLRTHNHWTFHGLELSRLLKEPGFRKQSVRREDYPLLVEFWEMLAAGQSVAVLFQLRERTSAALLLQGWPGSDGTICHGYLREAYLPAAFARDGISGTCQMDLGGVGYPVLAIDVETHAVLAANPAAQALFTSVSARQDGKLSLADITSGDQAGALLEAARRALVDDVWAGTLGFCNAQNLFSAKVRLMPCAAMQGERKAIRIALLNIPENEEVMDQKPSDAVWEETPVPSLQEGLAELYAAYANQLDGLMFSDIQSRKGRVVVYGVGTVFADLDWGAEHAYEGTIAQDIERFGLHSLTVEDTLDSVKSIDWILFTPHGVRSYYARPFYGEQGLHAVLILASKEAAAFGADADERFAGIMPAFERLVRAWRGTKK